MVYTTRICSLGDIWRFFLLVVWSSLLLPPVPFAGNPHHRYLQLLGIMLLLCRFVFLWSFLTLSIRSKLKINNKTNYFEIRLFSMSEQFLVLGENYVQIVLGFFQFTGLFHITEREDRSCNLNVLEDEYFFTCFSSIKGFMPGKGHWNKYMFAFSRNGISFSRKSIACEHYTISCERKHILISFPSRVPYNSD